MEEILPFIGFISVVALLLWLNIACYGKAKRNVHEWAVRQGFTIIEMEQRLFQKGPFFWTSGKNQVVYYVVMKTPSGKKGAYVRCGGFWSGLLSDSIEVKWDQGSS